jgi:hypothetical protein
MEATGKASQYDVKLDGHAIQCRITTEDPTNNFIPDYGRITAYRGATGMGIRLDGGTAYSGAVITRYYDSLLEKVTAWAPTPEAAIARMDRALARVPHPGRVDQHRLRREPAEAPDLPELPVPHQVHRRDAGAVRFQTAAGPGHADPDLYRGYHRERAPRDARPPRTPPPMSSPIPGPLPARPMPAPGHAAIAGRKRARRPWPIG